MIFRSFCGYIYMQEIYITELEQTMAADCKVSVVTESADLYEPYQVAMSRAFRICCKIPAGGKNKLLDPKMD